MKQIDEPYAGLVSVAYLAGEHAVLLFAVSLVLVMVVVLSVWGIVHRYGMPREEGGPSHKVLLVIHLAVSFGVIVGAGALFAAIADEIGVGETLGRVDQAFADGIASAVPIGMIRTFALITHLGDAWLLGIWCVLGAAILTVQRKYALALGFVLAIVGNGLLNNTLKHVFERVRPVHDQSIATASGWSFPSGHSSGSLVTYGIIAYVLVRVLPEGWRLPTVIAATVIAFTTASSRVFLRVHFASDVLAGFALGTLWLVACILSIELTRRYWPSRRQA
ncbi:phosphatase PAP2 family protein [Caballeronia sp. SEWSISQ10-4 2]|uniref:phosphatase PAP2 family protein n=1 Tax=Caballeronia sp. SEWSISQ10-4 2 TaxID=2937438 RepID=UPI00264FADC4|nr:phosphatase PAP2 family protein [Caballeronia sp. SEWSISQ10-4 2]MDN7177688.1 phosphatase PAP2 family protein [Caballeronia sp. SEWSISQ10-4 2]